MKFVDDGTDEEDYEHINRTNFDINVMKISLIITKGKYGAIDADYYSCRGYYIINFYSSPYTLKPDLYIDLFHPKMPPLLAFSGIYQKAFIHRSNRTNLQ